MNLRKQLSSYIALNNYVEAIRSSQLPAGYTELEYIESTGTQYIDTGVKASDCYGIYADFTPLGTHGLSGVFGSNTEVQNGTSLWLNNSSSGVAFYIRPNTIVALSPQISINNILNTRCVFSMFNRVATFTYNNVTSSGTYNFGTTTYDTTIKVCGCSAFYDIYSAKAKYNKFMLYGENNTLVRNFIPAKRNSDNVLGMYDTISGTFFTNSGIGSFVAGPEVYKSSIVLTDAITNGLTDLQLKGSEVKNKPEMFLDSVVAKGGTEQNGTPTPDTPIDIVSNNGVLKVRHQSGLPLGYTLLDYIQSSGTQYIDTGIANWNNTLEYEIKLSIEQQSGIKTYYGCYEEWNTSKNNVPNISTWANYKVASNFRAGYGSSSGTDIGIINGQTGTISLKGNTISWSEGTSTSFDRGYDFTVSSSIFLFAQHAGSNGVTELATTKIYRAKFWLNGELICDLRPCLDYNNVVGMYDTVSGAFLTNAGTGEFVAGNPVSDPVEIYTDGTVETIESHGKNLCDSNAFQSGYVNPKDGAINTNPQWLHTDYLYIGDAETYTYSLYTSVSVNAGRECAFYDKDKKFISGNATFMTTNHVGEASKTFTVPEGAKYIRISVANLSESQKDTKVQLEQGATPTEYEPYFDGGTATAEMLLKVGDYQDEQEILSGAVTRNVGVKVLDGTEDWTKGQSFYCNTLTGVLQADHSCYCTHYQGIMNTSAVVTDSNTCRVGYHIGSEIAWDRLYIYADRSLYATAQDFANYLADQYAAGTPVIVVYPLNASTTETVSPQKLLKNPVTVTEASIDNLEVTTTEAEHTVPTPDYPLDIACNNGVLKVGPNNSVIVEGTPETVTITGKNLFNESHIKSVAIGDISVVIPVEQNKTYTWSYNKTEYDFRFDSESIWGVDLNGNKVENGVTLVYANGTYRSASYMTVTVVSPNVVALQTVFRNNIIQSTKENVLASSMQLEEGIRPTKYEEYYQASFAPEDLLKLGDYQDVQSVLDGIVTRNIGVKVLDGTEFVFSNMETQINKHWLFSISFQISHIAERDFNVVLSSHFVGGAKDSDSTTMTRSGVGYVEFLAEAIGVSTIAEANQWLADQYAAGTPVIVVYPLANTVEETVESRDVFITSGTNTIERNSEYVSSDDITVKYKKLR